MLLGSLAVPRLQTAIAHHWSASLLKGAGQGRLAIDQTRLLTLIVRVWSDFVRLILGFRATGEIGQFTSKA